MRLSLLFLLILGGVISGILVTAVPCEEECTESEYNSYVDCIRKRSKRAADCSYSVGCEGGSCETSCSDCDCNYCSYNQCQSPCLNCCMQYSSCDTNHCCHRTCHAQCKNSACRSNCRKNCYDTVSRNSQSKSNLQQSNLSKNKGAQNITTVINLHNLINNTNIIDMPINVNSTNINNITLDAASTFGGSYGGYNDVRRTDDRCCRVIGPRQCIPHKEFPFVRCFHYRRKMCGSMCGAPLVHAQPHQICDTLEHGQSSCHQQMFYIPQPKPRCSYTSSWPYVACGYGSYHSCEGCYAHYSEGRPARHCSSGCYDDGFGYGTHQYFRLGPFYQPSFSHMPSCMQLGSCGSYGGYSGFGGYGGMTGMGAFSGIGGLGYGNVGGMNGYSDMGEYAGMPGYGGMGGLGGMAMNPYGGMSSFGLPQEAGFESFGGFPSQMAGYPFPGSSFPFLMKEDPLKIDNSSSPANETSQRHIREDGSDKLVSLEMIIHDNENDTKNDIVANKAEETQDDKKSDE